MKDILYHTTICESTLACEPMIERMPNGELLCLCQLDGPMEPHPDNRVYFMHSADDGKAWSEKRPICHSDKAVYCTELTVQGDKATAFITFHSGRFLDWQCRVFESDDNGYTWQDKGPAPLVPDYTFVRRRVVLKNGDVLYPYQHYDVTPEMVTALKNNPDIPEEQKFVWKTGAKTAYCGVLISHDGGKTFENRIACEISLENRWIWPEPHVAEFEAGHLVMLIRPSLVGRLSKCESFDGGNTWGSITETDIPNPSNKPFFMGLENGDAVLLHTPNDTNLGQPGVKGHRTPFEAWFTNDGAETWYKKVHISDDSRCDYADAFEEDGKLYIVQEHFRKTVEFYILDLKEGQNK